MAYRDALFPTGLAYGFRGGPMFNTTVLELASGFEKRNINWSQARAQYDVSHLVKKPDTFAALLDWFFVMEGRGHSFKFWDNKDDTITAQSLGDGDGAKTVYQIYKEYRVQGVSQVFTYHRWITKIQPALITGVTVGGAARTENAVGSTGFTVDRNTGKITFNSAPALDAEIILGSVKFYVHVRLNIDYMDTEYTNWEAISWGSILFQEVREKVTP